MTVPATDPSGSVAPADPTGPVVSARRHPVLAASVVGTVAAGVTLVLVLRSGGALLPALLGLPDPGPVTAWGLPVVRLVVDLAGALAAGALLIAGFAVPGGGEDRARFLAAPGYRLVQAASAASAVWALATLAMVVFSTSDLLGRPIGELSGTVVLSYVRDVSQGRALLVQFVVAAVVAIVGKIVLSVSATAALGLLALAGTVPPALTGHAAGAGNHQVAVTSLVLHVAAASLWLGGLLALTLLRRDAVLAVAAPRFSRVALWSMVAVAASGLLNAGVRVGSWEALLGSSYGVLVVGKAAALVVLVGFGAWHRRRTLPALIRSSAGDGDGRAFRWFAAGEVVVFAVTAALAVGLSRSPTPVPTELVEPDPVTNLIGIPMPLPPTPGRMIGDWLPDVFFLGVALVAAGLYLAGLRRLWVRGVRWPVGRTASWLLGLLVLTLVTSSGLARYAYVLFSVHMTQHMVLSMLVPILLVLGAPITLALRALRPGRTPGLRGPREWLLIVLHSRLARFYTHPLVALTIFIVGLYGLYFTGIFEAAMRSHIGHVTMLVHFLIAGYLFFWVIIGIDPGRRQLPHPVLIPVHFSGMIFHAFFGVALLQATAVIANGWYSAFPRTWGGSLLDDQNLGAGITWAFGEIPSVMVLIALVVQWIRADEREQRRVDRAADRAEARAAARAAARVAAGGSSAGHEGEDAVDEHDELAKYNAMLRRLATQDPNQR